MRITRSQALVSQLMRSKLEQRRALGSESGGLQGFPGIRWGLTAGLLLIGASGCGTGRAEFPEMDVPIAAPASKAKPVSGAPKPASVPRRGTLERSDVLAVVDAGLGMFLQKLEVDASLQHGTFQGFRILRLMPAEYWRGVDLRPGDVVTKVNGLEIERPPEAHRAFASLKTADQLVVSYLRSGEPRELVYRIVDQPAQKPAARQAPAKPGGA